MKKKKKKKNLAWRTFFYPQTRFRGFHCDCIPNAVLVGVRDPETEGSAVPTSSCPFGPRVQHGLWRRSSCATFALTRWRWRLLLWCPLFLGPFWSARVTSFARPWPRNVFGRRWRISHLYCRKKSRQKTSARAVLFPPCRRGRADHARSCRPKGSTTRSACEWRQDSAAGLPAPVTTFLFCC